MAKRAVLAVVAVFVTWSVVDFIVHGVILRATYEAAPELWRPVGEMKMGLIHFAVLVFSIAFVTIYVRFFAEHGIKTGVQYGLWLGLGTGMSMGYCTYAVMPIPYNMALIWFLATVVEMTLGGLLLGLIVSASARQPV